MRRLFCIFAVVATTMANYDLEALLKKSNDRFTANMFQEVVKSHKNQSCVQSAFSVLSPLAQLALASVGKSHDEILKVIGFPNDTITKQVFSDLNSRLRSVKGVDLELANKIYIREDYSLNDAFAASSKKVFNSEVENIDFQQNLKAAAEINAWVEDHTHKRIKNLVSPDSIQRNTAAILVNAIYFKGTWKKPFNKYLTQNRSFHVSKDRTSSLPLMTQIDNFKYAENKEFDAKFLAMEYEGGETSLVLGLPNKIDSIDEFIEKNKNPSALSTSLTHMKYERVEVYLPRFKVETTTDLKGVLEKMKIKDLFSANDAKLYNLLKETKDLYVSSALQKAFIEVNEKGAEAAAANVFSLKKMESEVIYFEPPKEFKADHPFLFFIMEKNNILFNGVFRS